MIIIPEIGYEFHFLPHENIYKLNKHIYKLYILKPQC